MDSVNQQFHLVQPIHRRIQAQQPGILVCVKNMRKTPYFKSTGGLKYHFCIKKHKMKM